ncbi:hypothetical protein SAMN00017405_0949 [Desulfonispora thiosulfatigenes DSM 11270]|uniref:Uncharacterized protein n=1 Tax=Desulfonispora thiosulfatigenes DSM 11270 TaxID=656914 RepID=A0A1W1UNJ7_DESTI|nr:hypothetical protein [Desulfonispora thiosulfatigenes]SMB82650.1 hypothetical protein SAMN00017405_0949 [Desulfonispora thiosulfatigenes DSM 11270]
MSKTKLSVVQILDSDDYDTVVTYGLDHGNFEGVIQVDIPSENSWLEDETEPFLVFYNGKQPAPGIQLKTIAEGLKADREENLQGKNNPSIEPPHNEYLVVEITNPDSFSLCADLGMKHANEYSRCLYYLDDQVYPDRHFIIFYNGWNSHPDI